MMMAMKGVDDSQSAPDGRRRRGSGNDLSYDDPARADARGDDPELSRCGSCGSMLVQPLDWALVGRSHWRVVLRCPNCEWTGTGVFDQETVDRYDRELDRGTRKLQNTLARVARACMEAEIERFAKALETDLIVPFDF
jgi:hypothetical protein